MKRQRREYVKSLLAKAIEGGEMAIFEIGKSYDLDIEECEYLADLYEAYLEKQNIRIMPSVLNA